MKKMLTVPSGQVMASTFYSKLLDIIPDPLVITRRNGTIIDLNKAFTSFSGLDKRRLVGKHLTVFEHLAPVWRHAETSVSPNEVAGRTTIKNRHYEILSVPFRTSDAEELICILLKDVTTFIRLEQELLKRNKELIIINTLSSTFISSESIDLVLEELIDKVFLITDFHTGWLLLKEEDRYHLKISKGITPEFKRFVEHGLLDQLCDDSSACSDPFTVFEANRISNIPHLRDEGIKYLVSIPLITNKTVSGLLFLASRVPRDFDFDFAALMSLVGNNVSHIIDKIRLFQETQRLAITDGLTGLYNSRFFFRSLENEIARTRRYGQTFSLILFDIDNFKKLNDTFGHQAGDEALQGLADVFRAISRQTDIIARYGGEEFVLILPNTGEEETLHLANRIRMAVERKRFSFDTATTKITLSGGIATFPQNADDARTLLNAADTALYKAKASGKNTVICYKGKLDENPV